MSEAWDVIVWDVHGCLDALRRLCGALGYDDQFHHPEGRTLAFVGDLIDRGLDGVGVLRVAVRLHKEGRAAFALGNHDDALRRYLAGESVDIHDGGLDATIDQINAQPDAAPLKRDILQLFTDVGLVVPLDGGRLLLAHAGVEQHMLGHEHEPEVRRFILNGDAIGKSPKAKPCAATGRRTTMARHSSLTGTRRRRGPKYGDGLRTLIPGLTGAGGCRPCAGPNCPLFPSLRALYTGSRELR